LKLLALELKAPVLALSQLSRANEKRGDNRPVLSDLRDSGALEQDADCVSFIYRPEVYKPDRGDLKGVAEWIVAKGRESGIGTIPLRFIAQWTRFESASDEVEHG
jgi:replicative DNA helicase